MLCRFYAIVPSAPETATSGVLQSAPYCGQNVFDHAYVAMHELFDVSKKFQSTRDSQGGDKEKSRSASRQKEKQNLEMEWFLGHVKSIKGHKKSSGTLPMNKKLLRVVVQIMQYQKN